MEISKSIFGETDAYYKPNIHAFILMRDYVRAMRRMLGFARCADKDQLSELTFLSLDDDSIKVYGSLVPGERASHLMLWEDAEKMRKQGQEFTKRKLLKQKLEEHTREMVDDTILNQVVALPDAENVVQEMLDGLSNVDIEVPSAVKRKKLGTDTRALQSQMKGFLQLRGTQKYVTVEKSMEH